MNATLVTALIGLAGLVLGSSTTIAALSPASRRLKRLGQLVELRPSVEDGETRRRIDYATEQLAHQIAEDAVASGDRASGRATVAYGLGMTSGLGAMLYFAIRAGEEPNGAMYSIMAIGGALMANIFYIFLFWKFNASPKKYANTVERDLEKRRDRQWSESARAEGVTKGDVPAS